MFKNLHELISTMPDEISCRDYLIKERCSGVIVCPYCGCEGPGKTPKEIFELTGWEKSKDKGKWKYDLPYFVIKDSPELERLIKQKEKHQTIFFSKVI